MESKPRICRVCLLEHDDEIHAATLSVRDWFRDQVMLSFYYDDDDAAITEPQPEMPAVQCVA